MFYITLLSEKRMSSLRYQIFYRKYGVRLPQQVITPIMHDLSLLDLPMKSIYHYVKFDGIELGPPADEFLFRNIRKPIFVGSISEVGDSKGNPRRLAINENNLLRDYRGQNRRIRPLRDLSVASKDPHTLVVYNYCFIAKMHKYIRSFYTEYFKWYNTFAAVMKNIAAVTQQTENQQFLVLGVPMIIPSLGQLNIASKALTQTLMKVFKESNGYTLIEIWKWLGENRETSLLNLIPKNKLHLVNLIYQESGKWTVINLGVLNSFRTLDENETEDDYVIKSNVKLNPLQLQKRFLRFIMSVTETRAEMLKDSIKDENEDVKDNPEGTEQVYSTDADDDSDKNSIFNTENITINDQVEQNEDRVIVFSELDAETEEEYIARIQEEDEQLDEELNQLNEIASRHENDVAEQVTNETLNIAKVLEERQATPEEGVMNLCDRLAEEGLLTAGEYKRFNDLSQRYKVLDVPYPNAEGKTISEFIQIKPEELLIDNNKVQFTESPSVLDKTMLRSSLVDLDTVYINNILPKHAVSMVTAIQQAGVAITDYNIEEVNDVLGAYEIHTVKITPVEGAPSTLNFKIPKVNKEGKIEIGGVGYVIRKQRGD